MKKKSRILSVLRYILLFPTLLFAADQVVTDNGDSGAGTLRQAIIDASSGDEIRFNLPPGDETITISSELSVTTPLTIDGSNNTGSGFPISLEVLFPGSTTSRVIHVDLPGDSLKMFNITIKGGDISGESNPVGGGIYCENGTLILNRVTISDAIAKFGGGLCNESGTIVELINSAISGNSIDELSGGGGGIYNAGSLTISQSTISNNTADGGFIEAGGGIYNAGTLNCQNSTISGNTSKHRGGGIYNAVSSSLNLANTTITSNTANAVGGGGIFNDGSTSILNSVIIDNTLTSGTGSDIYGDLNIFESWYEDLDGTVDNGNGNNTSSFTSGDLNSIDNNGGYTKTHSISSAGNSSSKAGSGTQIYHNSTDGYYYYDGSDYVKVSDGSTITPSNPGDDLITTDQLGYYRSSSDVTRGAFQYQGVVAKIGSGTSWTGGTNTYSTITDAVTAASSGNTVVLAETYILESGISVNKPITIEGNSSSTTVGVEVPGTTTERVFNFSDDVTLQDMTIRGGDISGSGDGGGIFITSGQIAITGVNVKDSKAVNGGGIAISSGTLEINNSSIVNNSATGGGGGIYINSSSTSHTITNTTISGNRSDGEGGGLWHNAGTLTITNATITRNHALNDNSGSENGGGISIDGNLAVRNTAIVNNYIGSSTTTGDDYFYSSGGLTDNGNNAVKIQDGSSTGNGKTFDASTDILWSGSQWEKNGSATASQSLNLSSTIEEWNATNGTLSYLLNSGSLLIDAGTSTDAPSTDQRGASRNSTYDIGATEWWDDNGALPVELISFEGYIKEKEVVLEWETATETNNFGFEVQKSEVSSQQSEWETVGFVQGNGTTNSPKNYEFSDSELPNSDKVSYRLKQIDSDGTFAYSKTITVDLTTITSIKDGEIPIVYSLSQNYPNPFNPTTIIRFGLPKSGFVDLRVYNILGEEVARLVNKEFQAGYHEISFGGMNLASGIYVCRINVDDQYSSIKKMLLLK